MARPLCIIFLGGGQLSKLVLRTSGVFLCHFGPKEPFGEYVLFVWFLKQIQGNLVLLPWILTNMIS